MPINDLVLCSCTLNILTQSYSYVLTQTTAITLVLSTSQYPARGDLQTPTSNMTNLTHSRATRGNGKSPFILSTYPATQSW